MFIILKTQFKFLLLLTSYVKLKCDFNSNIVFHRSFMVGLAVLGLWLVLMTSEVCFNIKDHMIPLFPHQFQTSEALQKYFKFYCLSLSSFLHLASLELLSAQSSIISTFFPSCLSAKQSLPNHLARLLHSLPSNSSLMSNFACI